MTSMPSWEGFMIPALRVLDDGSTLTRRELAPRVARDLQLTPEQVQEVLASGQPTHANRTGWAVSFLTNVGALDRPARGHYRITDAGRTLLRSFPDGLTEKLIDRLGTDPDSPIRTYIPTLQRATPVGQAPTTDEARATPSQTPSEQVEEGIARIHDAVSEELLERLRSREPAFFERAVVDLLLAMGYGGVGGSGAATQLVNDGGIDGVIDQDVLGLNKVYIQAKRYAQGNSVGRPELQGFVGALSGRADRGVFITTSHFSQGALDYANFNTGSRLILIDGDRLTELMIRFGVGVQVKETFHVVEVDEDFFE